MARLEFEIDRGQQASASDFFAAGSELIRALDALADEPVEWTFADLRLGSAVATVTSDQRDEVTANVALVELISGLQGLRQGVKALGWNPEVIHGMKAFAKFVDPGPDEPRARLTLIHGGQPDLSVPFDRTVIRGLSEWKPVDRLFQGSAIGRVVGVNVARGNRASLRPKVGRVVHVRFTDELADDMKAALYSEVEVFGTLRRDEQDRIFHIAADAVTVLPDTSTLSWTNIFGSDPNFTGGLPADRYLEESRGEA